jgi:hypothetical protein
MKLHGLLRSIEVWTKEPTLGDVTLLLNSMVEIYLNLLGPDDFMIIIVIKYEISEIFYLFKNVFWLF